MTMAKHFDYKTADMFTGVGHRPKVGKVKANRDRDAIDIFTNDTDRESGRPVIKYDKPIPSVAESMGLTIGKLESGE